MPLNEETKPNPNEYAGYETKQSDGEAPVILEFWGMHSTSLSYLPTPPLGQDMTQGQLFKRSLTGLNSEFSFT